MDTIAAAEQRIIEAGRRHLAAQAVAWEDFSSDGALLPVTPAGKALEAALTAADGPDFGMSGAAFAIILRCLLGERPEPRRYLGANADNFGAEYLVNLTPHEIVIVREDGSRLHAWPSCGEARASATRVRVAAVVVEDERSYDLMGEVPVSRTSFGEVAGLPEPVRRPYGFIVSRVAAEAARAHGRATDDLLIPDDLVRDPEGQPIGCRGFARL